MSQPTPDADADELRDEFSEEEEAIEEYLKDGEKENWLKWTGIVLAAVFLATAGAGTIAWWVTVNKTTAGQFGDTFGFVNAIVSGMAFALFVITLLMQRHELGFQRKELRLNLIEMKRSRREHAKMATAQRESEKRLLLSSFVSSIEMMREMLEKQTRLEQDRTLSLERVEEGVFLQAALPQLSAVLDSIRDEVRKHHGLNLAALCDKSKTISDVLLPRIQTLLTAIRAGEGDDGKGHGVSLWHAIAGCGAGVRNILHLVRPNKRRDADALIQSVDDTVHTIDHSLEKLGQFEDPQAVWGKAREIQYDTMTLVFYCCLYRA